MANEILDNDDEYLDNKSVFRKIGLIGGAALLFFLVMTSFRDYLPENLMEFNDVEIKTVGAIIFMVFIAISALATKVLNEYKPELKITTVALIVGLLLFAIALLYKLIGQSLILGYGLKLDYYSILVASILFGIIGFLFSFSRIHSLRKNKSVVPTILIIVFLIFFNQLIKYLPV